MASNSTESALEAQSTVGLDKHAIGSLQSQEVGGEEEKKDEQQPDDDTTTAARDEGTHLADDHQEQDPRIKPSSSFRRMSRQLSQSLHTEYQRRKPETPAGWAALATAVSAAVVGYEVKLQQSLTMPPMVYGQASLPDSPLKPIYDEMTKTPESILSRKIQPSLFVGTRGMVASTAAYALGGPSQSTKYVRFRQILTMTQDGARVALDWELAPNNDPSISVEQQKEQIQNGPIQQPVVLICHGINNDASFGYVQSLMRTCTKRGWNAVGMNFRGCGGVPLVTPRGYNGAYTGDIRCVVWHISARMGKNVPMFIVGNSLGANLVTKYLGEEGSSGTLPECVAGGVSLGNPLMIHSGNTPFPWGHLLALGVKKTLIENWKHLRSMKKLDAHFQDVSRRALLAGTIAEFDEAVASVCVRNDAFDPFSFRIGYKNGESYWTDASSFRLIRHISIPMLQLTANDDFLVGKVSTSKLVYSLLNPNVMVVNTRCGGHLGWQESPPDTGSMFGFGTSWADTATADFFQAIIDTKRKQMESKSSSHVEGKQHVSDTSSEVEQLSGAASNMAVSEEAPMMMSKL